MWWNHCKYRRFIFIDSYALTHTVLAIFWIIRASSTNFFVQETWLFSLTNSRDIMKFQQNQRLKETIRRLEAKITFQKVCQQYCYNIRIIVIVSNKFLGSVWNKWILTLFLNENFASLCSLYSLKVCCISFQTFCIANRSSLHFLQ